MFEFLIELVLTIVGDLLGDLLLEWVASLFTSDSGGRPSIAMRLASALVGGVLVGWLSIMVEPSRILPSSPFPGASLFLAPVLVGVVAQQFGARRESGGHQPTVLATFWGGALFAFGVAVVRFLSLQGRG